MTKKEIKRILEIYEFNDDFDYDRASLQIALYIANESEINSEKNDYQQSVMDNLENHYKCNTCGGVCDKSELKIKPCNVNGLGTVYLAECPNCGLTGSFDCKDDEINIEKHGITTFFDGGFPLCPECNSVDVEYQIRTMGEIRQLIAKCVCKRCQCEWSKTINVDN